MSDEQDGVRRRFTAQEKVAILRQHLVEKVPVSEVCDKHGLNPTAFYRWQKEFFENGAAIFESRRSGGDGKARSTSTTPGCPPTTGWRTGRSRPSSPTSRSIHWKATAA